MMGQKIKVGSIVRAQRGAIPASACEVGCSLKGLGIVLGESSPDLRRSWTPQWSIYWFKMKKVYWCFEPDLELIL